MNNGDGIRMAQDLGAALWHMWHIHGAYGFRHTDPNYPYGIRVKRFPDWFPGDSPKIKMAWILLDQCGKRFMSEYQPYTQDTAVRPMQYYDPVTQRYPRNPALMIFDEEGRRMYPVGKATSNDEGIRSNTQGGPVHDAQQRIIDVFGKPIPRLYSAGELGSSFGHLYLSGGNIAECFVTGRIAGRNAASI